MQYDGNRESDNVEDRRDDAGGGGGFGGGGGGLGSGGLIGGLLSGRVGIGSIVVALAASYFLGINPLTVLGFLSGGDSAPQISQQQGTQHAHPTDETAKRVSQVLASTEDIWRNLFAQNGMQYKDSTLVMFRGATRTACGQGQSAMGPFYCPADAKVYIDLGFFQTLKTQLGSPGEFAQAYVIAHEVGHHVQHLLGVTTKTDRMQQGLSKAQQNAISVRVELQADCLAGVWAHHSQQQFKLTRDDIQSALNAASHIGDDALQRQAGGAVRPESFTHGSSEQRMKWFMTGAQSGNLKSCDTFSQ